ncbi:hypothetical protein V8D89_010020 [Ganoderma adspersum]
MDPSDAAAELAAEYNSILLANQCYNAASIVFIYEYFLTISEEAKYFWTRKFTGAGAVFFLNRYVPLTLYALEFASYASMLDQIPAHYGLPGTIEPLAGCIPDDLTPPDVAKRCSLTVHRLSLLVFITWFSLFKKGAFHLKFGTATLAEVLLRDGTIYFVILVVLNVLHLAFSFASIAVPALQNASEVTLFTEPITAIIIQRFLLHLQAANRRALDLDSSQMGSGVQRSSSVVFNRVIGSLGVSIPPEDFLGLSGDDIDEVEDVQEDEMGSQPEDT